jgi:hypothetical protein
MLFAPDTARALTAPRVASSNSTLASHFHISDIRCFMSSSLRRHSVHLANQTMTAEGIDHCSEVLFPGKAMSKREIDNKSDVNVLDPNR